MKAPTALLHGAALALLAATLFCLSTPLVQHFGQGLGAFALGELSATLLLLVGGLLMMAGVWVHLAEDHGHIHDDGHHQHRH